MKEDLADQLIEVVNQRLAAVEEQEKGMEERNKMVDVHMDVENWLDIVQKDGDNSWIDSIGSVRGDKDTEAGEWSPTYLIPEE